MSSIVLSVKNDEEFYVGDAILKVVRKGKNWTKIHITAPRSVKIIRESRVKQLGATVPCPNCELGWDQCKC